MLSSASSPTVTSHTNEALAPVSASAHAPLRSVSSSSSGLPTLRQRSRPTSIDLSSPSQSFHLTPSSSLTIHGYPRSSILLNPRKRSYKGLIYANRPTDEQPSSIAPVVTHIPAVTSRKQKEKEKEREKERERERDREREKERSRGKDDEKIWGIPKKALLLGLGDLNFNAQMAMMAGWGHGSGGQSVLPSSSSQQQQLHLQQQQASRKRVKGSRQGSTTSGKSATGSDSEQDEDNDGEYDDPDRRSNASSKKTVDDSNSHKVDGESSPGEERMDPEELAALNAIINTRRSMAAAQALVSGQITLPSRSTRGSSFGSAGNAAPSRPPLDTRVESLESVPSMSSFGHSSTSLGSSNVPLSPSDKMLSSSPHALDSFRSALAEGAELKSLRIRFAPLPTPSSAPPSIVRRHSDGTPIGDDLQAHPSFADELSDSDLSDSDFDSEDDSKSMKGKWYLMGMPPALFKPQYYTGKASRRKHSKSSSFSMPGVDADNAEDHSNLRRKSTGSLSEQSVNSERRLPAISDNDEEDRGRGSISSSRSKRKSSQTRRRSRSRTGAVSSGDEDERARRRQLIRLARPGGTGMVTLPDGTKIPARRVNDSVADEEPEFIEWGFAGLAKEASRRSLGGSNPASLATTPNDADHKGLAAYMEGGEDEEDDGSGMAWVRRRRRERAERARMEQEKAEKEQEEQKQEALQKEQERDQRLSEQESLLAVEKTRPSTTSAALNENTPTAKDVVEVVDGGGRETKSSEQAANTKPFSTIVSEGMVPATPTESEQVVIVEPKFDDLEWRSSSAPATASSEASDGGILSKASVIADAAPTSAIPSSNGQAFSADLERLFKSPTTRASSFSPSMEASTTSDASVSAGESAGLSESQMLRRSVILGNGAPGTGESTPRHTTGAGLALSADQAQEIRRRHEDEVAALGAEVLAQTRRNNQRRQASLSARGTASPGLGASSTEQPSTPSKGIKMSAPNSTASPPMMSNSAFLAKSSSRDSTYERKSLSRAVGSIVRKATADSDRTVHVSIDDVSKRRLEPSLSLSDEPETATAVFSSVLPETSPELSTRVRSQSPESTRSGKSSSAGYSMSAGNKSVSSLQGVGGGVVSQSPANKRISLDPSISTPAPSPWLPRRPDARGVSVVPLPQLGVRPERPREGRVWQYDVSDDSDAGVGVGSDKEDEEEGSDLDAEELEEEERKTAMQKKRATTRAAGQEIVHASLGEKGTSRAVAKMASSSSFDAAPSRQSTSSRRRSTFSGVRPGVSSSSPSIPAGPRKAPPKLVRKTESSSSFRRGEDEDSDETEDNLWPAVSATSKSGTPRPRHILVNLPGGPGIWDSKKGGGRNAVAAINSVAAARAKAVKKRAKDKRTSFELPPNWDDEMMDYGWPRSLKGALY